MSRLQCSKITLPSINPWIGKPKICVVENTTRVNDARQSSKIPPESICLDIRSKLYKLEEIMSTEERQSKVAVAIWPGIGTYDRAELSKFVKIHEARRTRGEVKEEKAWFAKLQSDVQCDHPGIIKDVSYFLDTIWSRGQSAYAFGLNIEALKRLCCNRWLSDDTLEHCFDMFNAIDAKNTFLVLTQEKIHNAELLQNKIETLFQGKPGLEFVHVALNVWKTAEGNVLIGNGNHWTYFVFDKALETLIYGDSLGWSLPSNLLKVLKPAF